MAKGIIKVTKLDVKTFRSACKNVHAKLSGAAQLTAEETNLHVMYARGVQAVGEDVLWRLGALELGDSSVGADVIHDGVPYLRM